MPLEQQKQLKVFNKRKIIELPLYKEYDYKIELKKNANVELAIKRYLFYFIPPYKLRKIKKYLKENLKKGFIQPNKSSFTSPILFIQKANGDLRFYVDYYRLNQITKKTRYLILLIIENKVQFSRKKSFSRFDIVTTFNNLYIYLDSAEYTMFKSLFDIYQYNVIPFRLTRGSSSQQRYINDILFPFLDKFYSIYLNNILVYKVNLKNYKQQVYQILEAIDAVGLQIDIRKLKFYIRDYFCHDKNKLVY